MDNQQPEFVRMQFSGSGLMCLFCARCHQLIAYSARPEVLATVEAIHARRCSQLSGLKQ